VPAVLTHGFPWRLFREGRRLRLPPSLFEPFRSRAHGSSCSSTSASAMSWTTHTPEFHTAIVQLVDALGSERLMWGTDMPNVERFCA